MAVEPSRRKPRRDHEEAASAQSKFCGVGSQEKLTGLAWQTSVPETDTGGRGEQPQVNE